MSKLLEKRAYWSKMIARYQNSHQSQRAFCESEGVNFGVFKYWLSRSKKQDSTKAKARVSSFSKISFAQKTSIGDYQIKLPNGLSCQVPLGFDPSELKNLLGVLVQC